MTGRRARGAPPGGAWRGRAGALAAIRGAGRSAIGAVAAMALGAAPALAHGAERGLVLLLPSGHAMAGGAAVVAVTFLALVALPAGALRRLARAEWPLGRALRLPVAPFSALSFLGLAFLVAAGWFASPDPLRNPLPLAVWAVFWVMFTQLQAVTGSLWRWANPWSWALRPRARWRLPVAWGYGPAILAFFAFAWGEVVSLAPDDPARLATRVALWWGLMLGGFLAFGAGWRRRGEPFGIYFGLIGRLSPLSRQSGRIALTWPGRDLARAPALPPSGVVFVLLVLGTASFDGWKETFAWLGLIGVNPLEFPGRSGVWRANTVGLLATPLILAGAFYAAVGFGARLAGTAPRPGRLVHSIVPIAMAFQVAHYLPFLLMNGQYAWVVASDPLHLGWDLLGTAGHHVTGSFLTDMAQVRVIWAVQTGVIVAGHALGLVIAHLIALEEAGDARRAALSQAPLAAAMVGYTVFGLWLLSTPALG